VPAVNALVLQLVVFVLDVPVGSATAPQPLIVVPLSVNAAVPVGAEPVTDAVNVTLVPIMDGLAELAIPVVLAALTASENVELVELVFAESPL